MSRVYLEPCSCRAPRCTVCNANKGGAVKKTKNFQRLNIDVISQYIISALRFRVYDVSFNNDCDYISLEIISEISPEKIDFQYEPRHLNNRKASLDIVFKLREIDLRESETGQAIQISQVEISARPSYALRYPNFALRQTYRSHNFSLDHAIRMVNACFDFFTLVDKAQFRTKELSLTDEHLNQSNVR